MKKVAIMIGGLLVMCFLLGACSGGHRSIIKFNIGLDQMGGFGIKEVEGCWTSNILEHVSSLQELQDLCEEWRNPSFQENSEYFSSDLSKKIRSYDETYFEEKILVIYSFDRGHRSETRIGSLEVDGEQLIINARYITRRGTFTDEAFGWLILIEINKVDVLGITSIHIEHRTRFIDDLLPAF